MRTLINIKSKKEESNSSYSPPYASQCNLMHGMHTDPVAFAIQEQGIIAHASAYDSLGCEDASSSSLDSGKHATQVIAT